MAFVLPAKMPTAQAPKPTDGALNVRELPPGRFAVLRYSGGRKEKNDAESLARLKTWLEQQQLPASASPVYAYFDPPWTPSFLRRNEVMLRTEAETPR